MEKVFRILDFFINKFKWKIHNKKLSELRKSFKHLGENVTIDMNSTFLYPENIIINDHVYIGSEAYIEARGGIEFGRNVILGPKVTILSSNHRYENAGMIPYDDYYLLEPVKIEKNVWIAANVNICPGVTIGEGSVIAMGSVITPKYSVMGGNPAKVIKTRDIELYKKLDEENMHYLKLKYEGKASFKYILKEK